MIKRLLVILVAAVVVLAIIGLLLPRNTQIARSITIARPASLVYATVNSFQLFPQWSPWQSLDPNMHQSISGPREGVGAKLQWSGNDKVGSGTQVITSSLLDRSVASDIDFGKKGVAKSEIRLIPESGSTRVTWTLDIDLGASPIAHYFGLMMDRMIGKDYQTGLDKLKALVEGMPNVDIAGFSAEAVEMTAKPILVVNETSPPDTASISKAYAEGYGQIVKFMARNNLQRAGPPLGIDGALTPTSFTFQAGIPVERGGASSDDALSSGNAVSSNDAVKLVQSYSGKALKSTHVGPYDTLPKTYDAFRAYMASHAYVASGPAISWYVDDPGMTPADKLRTEIYWPVH